MSENFLLKCSCTVLQLVLKMFLLIVLKRLQARVEPFFAEEQAGFRKDRSTVQQILMLRLIDEKTLRK